ncbi:MAG: FAD-dependent oxidoreductase [Synergistaceae bacterium]|nr:FAD-dependent oxidoreductase [Synergistaceae bacterium]
MIENTYLPSVSAFFRALSRKKKILFIMLCASFFSFSSPVHAEQQRLSYDVVIAGGGAGGTSAAIAAARLGVRVALIEETDWLGGQMTAAAVSTMDDLSGNRTGIYGEFYENIRYHYFLKGKSVSTCYWDGNTMAFEPSVGRKILSEMVKAAEKKSKAGGKKGMLDIYYRSKVTAVRKSGNGISGVTAEIGGKKVPIDCSVLIDATEYGDVIPLAGALYRAGNSLSPMISEKSRVQDITWTAVIKKYPGGIPSGLRMTAPPPGYEQYVPEFRRAVAKNGNSFRSYPLRMPVDFATHNGYRGLPDSSNPEDYNASSPEGWESITKTGVNWTNDYPGAQKWEGRGGLPVSYLEDGEFRKKANAAALLKTLSFIYYVQNELEEPWSVADDEFDSEYPLQAVKGFVPGEYSEIVRRFPLIPYVRESRRIVGLETPTSKDVRRNSESYRDGRGGREIPHAMAIGGYILDLHAADEDADLENEFGETAASIKTHMPRGPFQIPFGSFISRDVDGLVAAEKNLSMSRLVSGAFRLQPVSMLTGQAAGTIAALAAAADIPPGKLDPRLVQRHLLEAGSALSLCEYNDVPREHPFWPGVQMSNLYGWITPEELPSAPSAKIDDIYNNRLVTARLFGLDKGTFGVDTPLTGNESENLFRRAFSEPGDPVPFLTPGAGSTAFVTRRDFCSALAHILGFRAGQKQYASRYADIPSGSGFFAQVHFLAEKGVLDRVARGGIFLPESFVTKGSAADMMMRAVTAMKGE